MELASISIELMGVLFFVAVIAGLLDTLAGGGGLITVPALILSGVPPLTVLGTNKLQGSIGTATATYMMIKSNKISWYGVKPLMLPAFTGAAIGTIVVQFINTDILSFIIPAILLFIAVYFLLSPSLTPNNDKPKISNEKYKYGVIPLIGYYDGMFGPGTGSFFTLSGIACRSHDLLTSTAVAKPLNLSTNLASLTIFLFAGHILWVVGILMMIGQAIGAWLGAHCLFKINPAYLRGLVVLMCSGMLLKYTHSMEWIKFIQ
ncbi:TSUP family transporter [Microbulbifer sp. OS29]|uniref:Probable membrane transporter protein n=1 Tax=Microbulbifer okhotskensis TaxID=2926617 RepID=A0A9X2J6F8_9GAMM|nr:TSUP family transporter [Microbulbifer okhotskensis]MCO1335369.1 TSUP family transporter [Microbulbifer okhotskensis]